MRVGTHTVYNNFSSNQQKFLGELLTINNQITSGTKIQYGYEDTSLYIDTLRLDDEKAVLEQVSDTTSKAQTFSDNTDVALNQLKSSLEEFKTKLLQAANGVHSTTSLNAIANDLEALKLHMRDTANTSINGTYLFSGTNMSQKPIDAQGEYSGNAERLSAQAGDNLTIQYSIDGETLFFGEDSDYSRQITTNVAKFNLVELHHKVLSDDNPEGNDTEVLLTETDSIKALVGQPDDSAPTYFYLRGRSTNGETFKEKFSFTNGATVTDLLEKIGRAYGNTPAYQAVDVRLSSDGQIEVQDVTSGQMLTDFHLVGSDQDVDNLDDIPAIEDAHIYDFNRSGFANIKSLESVKSSQNFYDQRFFDFNTTLRNQTTEAQATVNDTVRAIVGDNIDQITINVNGTDFVHSVGATTTAKEMIASLKADISATIGNEVEVTLHQGQLSIFDPSASGPSIAADHPDYVPSQLTSVTFTAQDTDGGEPVHAFEAADGLAYDQARFTKEGAVLTANVSQTVKETSQYATASTQLASVAGSTNLDEKVITMDLLDVNGDKKMVQVTLRDVPDADGHLSTFKIIEPEGDDTQYDIFDEFGNKTAASPYETKTTRLDKYTTYEDIKTVNGVTYKQLMNIAQMAVGDTLPTSNDFDSYNDAVTASESMAEITMNRYGQMEIKDLTTSETNIQFSMYDEDTNRFDSYTKDLTKTLNQTYTGIKGEQGWNILETDTDVTLDRVFGFDFTGGLDIAGTDYQGNPTTLTLDSSTTLQEMMDAIDTTFGDGTSAAQTVVSIRDGRLIFKDNTTNNPTLMNIGFTFNNAQVDMHTEEGPVLSFSGNNAITVDQSEVDFFAQLDQAIDAVRSGSYRADADNGDPRNMGIQNSITVIDHLLDHVSRLHTENGANGQSLQLTYEKTEMLILNVTELKSLVLDTDVGESIVKMNQQTVAYQALLSSLSRINQLNLTNYL